MEPERLEPTLAERLEASAELSAEGSESEDAAADSKNPLKERVAEFRKRLVIKEAQRRWWQPK